MKLRRLCCCLLAFVCIFFVAFSVSAFAYTVDSCDVTTDYGLGDSNLGPIQYTNFTTTITSSFTENIINVRAKIVFPETIKENAIFDLIIDFDYGNASSINAIYTLKDADGICLGSGEQAVTNKKLVLKDLVVDGGDASSMDIQFIITSPSWTEHIIEEPEPAIPTNLTGYTVTVPSGWSSEKAYGLFSVVGNVYNASYPDGVLFSQIGVGFPNGGTSPVANWVTFYLPNGDKISYFHSWGDSLTFDIVSGDTSNSSLIQWLYDNNATFEKTGGEEEPEPEDSYVGTWVLNPTLTYTGTSTIQFDDINGQFYGKKNSSSSSLVAYDIARIELSPTGTIFNVKNKYNLSSGYCYTSFGSNTWKSVYYSSTSSSTSYTSSADLIRTLVITEEPTNEIFKNWLKSNGSKQSTYSLARSSVEYTYNFTITSISNDITQSGDEYSGIIGWIKNVFNSITGLPARIANSIGGFFTTLGNKITALGDALLDGIKGLFIPSEDKIIEHKDKFTFLLEDRFGAVYDSAEIIDDFANTFNSQSQSALVPDAGDGLGNSGAVSFPSVTVNLAGTDFKFGGWNVDLKYPGFEDLYDALAMITNILATFYIVNAFRNRLEEVLHR